MTTVSDIGEILNSSHPWWISIIRNPRTWIPHKWRYIQCSLDIGNEIRGLVRSGFVTFLDSLVSIVHNLSTKSLPISWNIHLIEPIIKWFSMRLVCKINPLKIVANAPIWLVDSIPYVIPQNIIECCIVCAVKLAYYSFICSIL
jgi:hypothetical protein